MPLTQAVEYSPYQAAFFRVIDIYYRPLRNAAKLLARDGNASVKTAENWLAKKHAAGGDSLIALLARNEALRQELDLLVAQEKSRIK